ncbi:hypothetical protein BJX76DRAFT_353494 [Aspergillus varians]
MSIPIDPKHWTKQSKSQSFLISTDRSLLSLPAINAAFASDFIYWAASFPEDVLQGVINSSFCFGLYEKTTSSPPLDTTSSARTESESEPEGQGQDQSQTHEAEAEAEAETETVPAPALKQIGFARLITDRYTFAYLTDVYVLPEYQGHGLGGWLLACVDELLTPLPHLRWFMLRTGGERSVNSYRGRLGMDVLDNGDLGRGAVFMGKRGRGNMV